MLIIKDYKLGCNPLFLTNNIPIFYYNNERELSVLNIAKSDYQTNTRSSLTETGIR